MADKTKIEWAEASWSPVTGCSPISEGCIHCYAKRMAQRLKGRFGYPKDDPFRVTFHIDRLDQPLWWRKPRRIFVCSMSDLFHKDVKGDWMWRILDSTYDSPSYHRHLFLFLTKRPEKMAAEMDNWMRCKALSSLPKRWWLGISAENQQRFDERWPILAQIPAAKRFVSLEPLLSDIILKSWCPACQKLLLESLSETCGTCFTKTIRPDWIIVGGESGPGARPVHPDWVRSVRDQCQEAGVPFFFKQWGEWIPKTMLSIPAQNLFWSQKYQKSWGTLDISGNWFPETTPWNGKQGEDSDTKEYIMYKVGKKQGRSLLDGREWDEMP